MILIIMSAEEMTGDCSVRKEEDNTQGLPVAPKERYMLHGFPEGQDATGTEYLCL